MAVCTYKNKEDLPDNFPGIHTRGVNELEENAFKHFMGTFLLRRARYLGKNGNQSILPAGQSPVK